MLKRFVYSALILLGLGGATYAAFCPGTVTTGGGTVALPACNFYVSATGSDINNGLTTATPFLTFAHAQSVVQNVTQKVVCVRGGNYAMSTGLTFTAADNGETWQYLQADGVNSAVLNGGGTLDLVNLNSVANFTWNGIAITNVLAHAFYGGGGDNFTLKNSELSFNHGSGACGDGFPPILCIGPGKNWLISHNYIHDTIALGGVALFAFNSGDSIDGAVIDSNVILRPGQQIADNGGIYINMRSSGTTGGHVSITNNYVRDWGSSAVTGTGGMRCIYLDDNTSNSTVSGNVCGPPTAGAFNSGNENNGGAFLINGGTNNTISNNIIDLGGSSMVAVEGGSGNSNNPAPGMPSANVTAITSNIIISNFTGPLNDSWSGVTGFAYYQGGPALSYSFGGNIYVNYASGGSVFTNGQVQSDPSPLKPTTTALALTCPGGVYTLAANSVAFSAPTSFSPIVGGWGPPGFTLPTTTNKSC